LEILSNLKLKIQPFITNKVI